MDIVYKALDELIPYANNAKEHDNTQVKNLALSLDKYGWKQPVVIDCNNVIMAGHGRVLAAKQSRKWRDKPAPCIVADDLTDEQIREFRLVDNKSAESAWDFDALSAELENVDLSDFNFTFDIDTTSYMDAINDQDFTNWGGADNTHFSVTFVFPNSAEGDVKALIKDEGKEYITEMIMREARDYAEMR